MKFSEESTEFMAAFAAAQADIKNAVKSADNPHFRSKYSDLASIRDACQAGLSKQHIGVIQSIEGDDPELVTLVTRLVHKSGQWCEATYSLRPTKVDPQGIGSCVTYMRRYQLAAMTGVAPEDDDGNAASKDADVAQGSIKVITAAQHKKLQKLVTEVYGEDEAARSRFLAWLQVEDLADLPAGEFKRVEEALKKRLKEEAEKAKAAAIQAQDDTVAADQVQDHLDAAAAGEGEIGADEEVIG